ncbi:Septum site-determining protein MinD [Roseimaritima multifibrata]|uniref:Septum site-determining protein MinD n=1 Tax=Roseimaritima multifibrata TaxID=1930274 RepID=A0A517MB88_9BACT|nr:AAA family ATPase [Roseimaritima multifibrata]QDS92111.1 Septum site-determining protein MinD [Roseimaritima multifibrata]
MSNVLRLAIVDPDDGSRESLKSLLLGMDTVWLEAECSRYEFFADVVEQTTPDVGVVALDTSSEKGIELIAELSASHPDCALLAASSSTDGHLILKTMRAGAREFITLPINAEDLVSALGRVGRQRFGESDGKTRSCEVIAIAGATGGVGSTSLAVNMACVLATQPGTSVALVDLDMALGDADVFLDAIPDYTLADVAQNISRLDIQLLKRSLTKHSSGLYLLPRPVELKDAAVINAESLRKVLGLLKASFTHLIFDLSKSYSSLDMTILEEADHAILVTQLDLPCLRNVVRLMMSFEETNNLKEKTKIVVNRAGLDTGGISLKKAKETMGRDVFAQLPNDYRTMVEVRNNGVPLITQAPKAGITQAVRDLVHNLVGESTASPDAADADAKGEEGTKGVWQKFWPVGQKK